MLNHKKENIPTLVVVNNQIGNNNKIKAARKQKIQMQKVLMKC